MENKEQIEWVIANLNEAEISAIALEKLKKTNTDNELLTYAGIKVKYYAEKERCAAKMAAKVQKENAVSSLDSTKIF